jgi:hypothetical protein
LGFINNISIFNLTNLVTKNEITKFKF